MKLDSGNIKHNLTIRLKPSTRAQIETLARGRGVSLSQIVEEAIEQYAAEDTEREADHRNGISAKLDSNTERLAKMTWEAQLRTEQVLAMMYEIFPRAGELSREELRKKARSGMEQARKSQRSERRSDNA